MKFNWIYSILLVHKTLGRGQYSTRLYEKHLTLVRKMHINLGQQGIKKGYRPRMDEAWSTSCPSAPFHRKCLKHARSLPGGGAAVLWGVQETGWNHLKPYYTCCLHTLILSTGQCIHAF